MTLMNKSPADMSYHMAHMNRPISIMINHMVLMDHMDLLRTLMNEKSLADMSNHMTLMNKKSPANISHHMAHMNRPISIMINHMVHMDHMDLLRTLMNEKSLADM